VTLTGSLAGVDISVTDRNRTRTYLVLHGGGGAATVASFADLLAERTRSRVVVPTHPGFGGTPRPEALASTKDLATAYVALLDELGLTDVTVVGNSFGGWIAAEIALANSPRVAAAMIVNGIGIVVKDHPMTSVAGLAPPDLAKLSFHDPSKAPTPPAGAGGSGPSPDISALIGYAGPTMSDPSLLGRLADVDLPVHVVWGDSDGIVDPAYGQAYADAIPASTFTLLPNSGHLPQIETPEALLDAIRSAE
jgi:pimeloyl-ACP methyl ester carboxylesterase